MPRRWGASAASTLQDGVSGGHPRHRNGKSGAQALAEDPSGGHKSFPGNGLF